MYTIEMKFWNGYRATRWGQDQYTDPYGAWPPSPWRFIRALAKIWLEYARETGDVDVGTRNGLFSALASKVPSFNLPRAEHSFVQIYHPTGSVILGKGKTPVKDRIIYPSGPVTWFWDVALNEGQEKLLTELVARMGYFGRVESSCNVRLVKDSPGPATKLAPNCVLGDATDGTVPVLAWDPSCPMDVSVVYSRVSELMSRPIPPGTRQYYAKMPEFPTEVPTVLREPGSSTAFSFDLIGNVRPGVELFATISNRVRGSVLKELGAVGKDGPSMTGEDKDGVPLKGHGHPFWFVEELSDRLRLTVHRKTPFTNDEVDAMLRCAGKFVWNGAWPLKLIPVNETIEAGKGKVWVSKTPFVFPQHYADFRKTTGRHSPEACASRLIENTIGVKPSKVELLNDGPFVHTHKGNKAMNKEDRARSFIIRVEFDNEISGPVMAGDSCHFGMGRFVPEVEHRSK